MNEIDDNRNKTLISNNEMFIESCLRKNHSFSVRHSNDTQL